MSERDSPTSNEIPEAVSKLHMDLFERYLDCLISKLGNVLSRELLDQHDLDRADRYCNRIERLLAISPDHPRQRADYVMLDADDYDALDEFRQLVQELQGDGGENEKPSAPVEGQYPRQRVRKGQGSIYQRKSDGRWVYGRKDGGQRTNVYFDTREEAEGYRDEYPAKKAAPIAAEAENPPEANDKPQNEEVFCTCPPRHFGSIPVLDSRRTGSSSSHIGDCPKHVHRFILPSAPNGEDGAYVGACVCGEQKAHYPEGLPKERAST